MEIGRVVAHIPARAGSKRVPSKNLRFLSGKPLISYAIECALACPELDDVYVNTDSPTIAGLAAELGCEVYRRPDHLGTDETTGEEFTEDFIRKFEPDTLLMISPVCPMLEASDISAAVRAYAHSSADTLISCTSTHLQTFCEDRPVNVDPGGPLAPSQENPMVVTCNWAVTIWNAQTFSELFASNRSGYFGRNRLFWPMDPWKAVKISTEGDFQLADRLMRLQHTAEEEAIREPRYWSIGDPVPK